MKKLIACFLLAIAVPVFALEPGSNAPNIYGRKLDNSLFRLAELKGSLVLNFFWVECKPCVKEMPELAKLASLYPHIKFVAVHVGDEDKQAVSKFIQKLSAHPETIVVASPMVKNAYGIRGLPHTVVIENGVIKGEIEGYSKKGLKKLTGILKSLYD